MKNPEGEASGVGCFASVPACRDGRGLLSRRRTRLHAARPEIQHQYVLQQLQQLPVPVYQAETQGLAVSPPFRLAGTVGLSEQQMLSDIRVVVHDGLAEGLGVIHELLVVRAGAGHVVQVLRMLDELKKASLSASNITRIFICTLTAPAASPRITI